MHYTLRPTQNKINRPCQPHNISQIAHMTAFRPCNDDSVLPRINLVESDDEEETDNDLKSARASINHQLSSSCHTESSSSSSGSHVEIEEDRPRPQRQMRRLSFGSCHTTVEYDRKMPVMDSLLQEYDSPASILTSNSRWNAEAIVSPPTVKRHSLPKQSRPTWNTQDETSKGMPKIPSRS